MLSWCGGMGVIGWLVMIGFWVGLIGAVLWAVSRLFPTVDRRDEVADLLDDRLALGEIDPRPTARSAPSSPPATGVR